MAILDGPAEIGRANAESAAGPDEADFVHPQGTGGVAAKADDAHAGGIDAGRLQIGERHVDGAVSADRQGDGRFVSAGCAVLQADVHGHVLRWRRQHREFDAVHMPGLAGLVRSWAGIRQAVGELIAQQSLPLVRIKDVAGDGQRRVTGEPRRPQLRRHAAVLLGEQHEPFEVIPVDAEAGVIGVRQGDRCRCAGGDKAPFDQCLAALVLNAQENVRTGSRIVVQVHFQRLEVIGGPMVAGMLAGRVGVVRLAQHAGGAGEIEIEGQGEGAFVP